MRKVLTFLAFVIALPLGMSAQQTATVNCLGQKKVYVTTVPDGTKIVAELKCGEKVVVLERSGNWAKVRTHNGKEGNLASVFLSVEEPSETHAQQPAVPSSSADGVQSSSQAIGLAYANCDGGPASLPNVQVYAGKDHSSSIATLACGEKVTVLGYEGSSVRVRKDNRVEGYVTAYFLQSEAQQKVFSRAKSSQKYPLTLEVAGASSRAYSRYRMPDTPATPAVTQCTRGVNSTGDTSASVDMTCKTTPGTAAQPGQEIQNVRVSLRAALNGVSTAIGCNAGWVASHCGELEPGSYQARWKNDTHKQIRVLALQAGRLREITFDVY